MMNLHAAGTSGRSRWTFKADVGTPEEPDAER